MDNKLTAQITVTQLKTVSDIIHEDYKKRREVQQNTHVLAFNKVIEAGLAKMNKLLDIFTIPVPQDLDEETLLWLIEKYRVVGWTIHLITEGGKNKYLRFLPMLDHEYKIFKPS